MDSEVNIDRGKSSVDPDDILEILHYMGKYNHNNAFVLQISFNPDDKVALSGVSKIKDIVKQIENRDSEAFIITNEITEDAEK